MTTNESFLNAYKSFEGAVKSLGFNSVLDYEGVLEKEEAKTGGKNENLSRIRLCRQCRNYLAHEAKDFFEANKVMIDFLNDMAGMLNSAELPIKKFAMKQLITENMRVQEAASLLCKRKAPKNAPVFNKDWEVVGYVSSDLICSYLVKNNITSTVKVKSVMETKSVKQMFKVVLEDTHFSEIVEDQCYLVKNAKGVVIGWY